MLSCLAVVVLQGVGECCAVIRRVYALLKVKALCSFPTSEDNRCNQDQ